MVDMGDGCQYHDSSTEARFHIERWKLQRKNNLCPGNWKGERERELFK